MVSAQARREQVDYAVSRGASDRHSCALLTVSRSALRYESTMPARESDADSRARADRGQAPALWSPVHLGAAHATGAGDQPQARSAGVARPGSERPMQEAPHDPHGPATRADTDGTEPGLGVRLRPRHLRQRAEVPGTDGEGRVDAGVPGDRGRDCRSHVTSSPEYPVRFTLGHRVVVRIALASHRGLDPGLTQPLV